MLSPPSALARSVVRAARSRRRRAQTPRASAPDRSHRLLGGGRHRRLALPHGDAGEGRLPRRADHEEALQIVNAWDPAADEAAGNQCKSYGAGAIMRVPGRLHITWQDDRHAASRRRRRHADAALPRFGVAAGSGRRADVAGPVRRAMGEAGRGRSRRRADEADR